MLVCYLLHSSPSGRSKKCGCPWHINATQKSDGKLELKYDLTHNHEPNRSGNVVKLDKRSLPQWVLDSIARMQKVGTPASKVSHCVEVPLEGGVIGLVRAPPCSRHTVEVCLSVVFLQ